MISLGISLTRTPIRTALATASAYAAAVAATGTPLTTERRALYEALIGGLDSDGAWSGLDGLMIAAAPTQAGAAIDVRTLRTATFSGGGTFTTDRGWTGDFVNGYIDMGEFPNAAGNSYSLDSACMGVWINQQVLTGSHGAAGVASGTALRIFNVRTTAGNEQFSINDNTADTLQANTGSKIGHRAASRTGAAIKRGFVAGVRVADLTTASTLVPTGNVSFGRSNTSYSPDRIAAGYYGGGMTDAQMTAIHNRLLTFLTAIGAQ